MYLFLCEPIHPDAYNLIKKEVTIINDIKDIGMCEIIINRNIKMDDQFLSLCHNLKLIIIHGTGYDDVDINYVKQHHIQLVNTPGLNSLSVAELIVNYMLQLVRNTYQIQHDFYNNKIHTLAPSNYNSHELSYKKVGLIGMGSISKQLIPILQLGFHNDIYAYSRSLTKQQADEYHVHYCSTIDVLLRECDFICINVPLNESTYHMISDYELSLMKDTAYLINTSRGAIIDTNALYNALVNHTIAGAAIDVIEDEPISHDHPLLQLDNIIYTPHIGGTTDEALKRIGMQILEIIKSYRLQCNL